MHSGFPTVVVDVCLWTFRKSLPGNQLSTVVLSKKISAEPNNNEFKSCRISRQSVIYELAESALHSFAQLPETTLRFVASDTDIDCVHLYLSL